MSEADVDQVLGESSKRMRDSDRHNKQQGGQEIKPSAKSRPPVVQPPGQDSHREKPLPSKQAAQPTLEKAAQQVSKSAPKWKKAKKRNVGDTSMESKDGEQEKLRPEKKSNEPGYSGSRGAKKTSNPIQPSTSTPRKDREDDTKQTVSKLLGEAITGK